MIYVLYYTFYFTESIFPQNPGSHSNQTNNVSHINQTNKLNSKPVQKHSNSPTNVNTVNSQTVPTPIPDVNPVCNRQTSPVTHPVTHIYQVDSLANTPTCEFVVGGHELGSDRSILTPVNVEETSKVNPPPSPNTLPRESAPVIDSSRQPEPTGNLL